MKAALYAFKIDSAKSIDVNIDAFLKMRLLLNDTPHALDNTSGVMILMNALHENYSVIKHALSFTG